MKEETIALCIITRDEEKFLGRCLETIKPAVDEIFITDTGSKDNTLNIARRFGANITSYIWEDNFSKARNSVLKDVKSDWILVLDADEIIAQNDIEKILELIRSNASDAYSFIIQTYTNKLTYLWQPNVAGDYYNIKDCSGWEESVSTRLFRNDGKSHYEGVICERLTDDNGGELKTKNSGIIIHHYRNLKNTSVLNERKKLLLSVSLKRMKDNPCDPKACLYSGIMYFENGVFEKAARILEKCLRFEPKNEPALFYCAAANSKLGQIVKAEKYLKKLISINPTANAYAMLGYVYMESGESERAIEAFEKALEFDPCHILAHNSIGVIYTRRREHRRSIKSYQAALEINPHFIAAKENLAAEYIRNIDWQNSFEAYKELLHSGQGDDLWLRVPTRKHRTALLTDNASCQASFHSN